MLLIAMLTVMADISEINEMVNLAEIALMAEIDSRDKSTEMTQNN